MDKKALTKLIITKTVTFISIVAVVSLFAQIFGDENTLVGVTTLVLVLVFLNQNFTTHPFRMFFMLFTANMLFGLAAYLVPFNLWLGIIINLVIVFSFTYISTFELRKSMTMTVGLHYLLLLASPVESDGLPLRFAALAVGPIIVMLTQLLFNRDKVAKTGPKTFEKLQTLLKEQLVSGSMDFEQAQAEIGRFKITVHDSLPKGQMPNTYNGAWLNLMSHFEYLFDELERNASQVTPEIKANLQKALHTLRTDGDPDAWRLEWSEHEVSGVLKKKLTSILEGIAREQNNIRHADPKAPGEALPKEFSVTQVMLSNMKSNSIRIKYASRLSIIVAIFVFLADYYDLAYWNWALYAIFFVTQPYIEYSFTRARKRAVGTLIGAIILLISFTLIEDPTQRTILLLFSGYLSSYVIDYQHLIIFVTISAIAAAALTEADPSAFVIVRVLWTGFGIVIAILANMFLFKTSYRDEVVRMNTLKRDIEHYVYEQTFIHNAPAGLSQYLYTISSFIADRVSLSQHDLLLQGAALHQDRLMHLVQLKAYEAFDPLTYQTITSILISNDTTQIKLEQLNERLTNARTVTSFTMISQTIQLLENQDD